MTDRRGDKVRAALDLALRDFQHPTAVRLALDAGAGSEDHLARIEGSEFSVGVDATDQELLVRVADYLQDQVFDQLEQTWGEARPPCPGPVSYTHLTLPTILRV